VTHANAPLNIEGRRRLVERCRTRPIAHVGRGSAQAKAAQRAKTGGAKGGYVYLHSAVDGFSRLAYTEPFPDEKAATTVAFLSRARAFFAAHGIHRALPAHPRRRTPLRQAVDL
jgi:hypothetical protein